MNRPNLPRTTDGAAAAADGAAKSSPHSKKQTGNGAAAEDGVLEKKDAKQAVMHDTLITVQHKRAVRKVMVWSKMSDKDLGDAFRVAFALPTAVLYSG